MELHGSLGCVYNPQYIQREKKRILNNVSNNLQLLQGGLGVTAFVRSSLPLVITMTNAL